LGEKGILDRPRRRGRSVLQSGEGIEDEDEYDWRKDYEHEHEHEDDWATGGEG
jgi:hypothetical protein